MRVLVIISVLLISCSKSKPKPQVFEINKAVSFYYEENECYIPMYFPKQISALEPQAGYLQLVRSNILELKESISDFKTSAGIKRNVKTNSYSLTEYGNSFYLKGKGLKAANLHVSKITSISEPSTYKGLPMVLVNFELEAFAFSPWYKEEVISYFKPQIPFDLPRGSFKKEEKFVLKNNEWHLLKMLNI
jgi:hypothetical protein